MASVSITFRVPYRLSGIDRVAGDVVTVPEDVARPLLLSRIAEWTRRPIAAHTHPSAGVTDNGDGTLTVA